MAFSNPYGPVITQVTLPFTSPIPGGLTNNTQIQIQGMVQNHPSADRFSINLCEGPQTSPNCAMHFNPRFTEGCIVRNAMKNGSWGHEERGGGMPIAKGQTFEIIIMCTSSGYFVAVNGNHFTEFKHRSPMDNVRFLQITGNYLVINSIKYEGGNMPAGPYGQPPAPGFSKGIAPPPYTPSYTAGGFAPPMGAPAGMAHNKSAPQNDILYNPSIPLTHLIPGRLYPNRMICISAIPHPKAKRFTFNLQGGPSGNINFHFDVRVNYSGVRNVVVRNSQVNGQWGREERDASYFPFVPGAAFDMIILADTTAFKVAVNNSHFITYNHRQPLENSNTLKITGDIRVTTLHFQ